MRRRLRIPRISKFVLREELGEARISELESIMARVEVDEVLVGIRFTENDRRMRLLRVCASFGQIPPWTMRRLSTNDLEYLAGATSLAELPSGIDPDQQLKLAENARRAERILNHRSGFWATSWATLAGAAAGAGLLGIANWVL